MARTYRQVWDGEWLPVHQTEAIACCDCGLVHLVSYRMKKGKLEAQWTRDNRRTAQIRRHDKTLRK